MRGVAFAGAGTMTGSMDLPAKGGFSFDLCRRNNMLEKDGLKLPGFRKTGTTIVGLVFQIWYQGHVSAALVLGGVDCTGPHLHTVYPHGSTDTLPFATMGSGSLAAMSVFESKYKEGLTVRGGIQLVSDAICAGIFNDLGSGSNVDVCVIMKGKTEYLRNHQLPNPRTYASSKGYSFTKGQTEVLYTKITPLKQKVEVAVGGEAMEE
ncbi:unnamed protein product [Miscanthus lutarioriparius]|uniref:Proteasome endopeptidase complex n=1 Tax=Miscanthus lutarioriparius TaxID=422564 RepID=A0A811SH25_9POAL|nr:unnamed protein product [Miscanthus lutarioriparius]